VEVIGGNGVPESVARKVSPAEVKPGEIVVDFVVVLIYHFKAILHA